MIRPTMGIYRLAACVAFSLPRASGIKRFPCVCYMVAGYAKVTLVSIEGLAAIFIYHHFYMEPNSFPIIRPAHADALQTRRAMRHRRLRSVRDRSQEQEVEKHHISPARLDLIRFKGKAFGINIISYKLDFSIFEKHVRFFLQIDSDFCMEWTYFNLEHLTHLEC